MRVTFSEATEADAAAIAAVRVAAAVYRGTPLIYYELVLAPVD